MLQYNAKPKFTSRRKDTTRNRYKDYSSTSHSTNYIHNYNNSSRCPYGNKYYNVIHLSSILALLLVGMIGNPYVVDSRVYAQEDSNTVTMENSNSYEDAVRERSEGDVANADNTNYTISRAVSPSASLTINSGSNVNSSAITTAGDVAYISNDVRVQASDIESYAVQISYASGSNSLSLADGSVVLSGANNTTPTNMSPNTWGYSWSSTNTNPESTTYQTLSTTNTRLSGDSVSNNSIDFTRRLTFAAKFGEEVKAGHYSTSVLLSLTATPKVVAGLDSITYMQEMTGEVCSHSPEGTTKRLIDNRDGNKYWVAKLKDNNCWMVQNLAYNGGGTSTSSPLTWKDTLDDSYYYNPGQYVYTTPIQSNNCDSQKGLSDCTGSGWSNVSGMAAYDIPNAPAIVNGNYYDAHYLSGNYYNWQAVNTGSICPTSWKIPEGGSIATGSSFHNLFSGLSSAFSQTINDNLTLAPYYFIRAGHIMSNKLRSAGQVGVYWTNTQSGTLDSAFGAHVGTSSPTPSASWGRYNGSSVRCVAL